MSCRIARAAAAWLPSAPTDYFRRALLQRLLLRFPMRLFLAGRVDDCDFFKRFRWFQIDLDLVGGNWRPHLSHNYVRLGCTPDQHCARIATAAEWLYDAQREVPSPTTFVQTAIALDPLYGGTETDPVVATLTNRIAYTLGRAPQERHMLSRQAQGVLSRALVHELELLSRGALAPTTSVVLMNATHPSTPSRAAADRVSCVEQLAEPIQDRL